MAELGNMVNAASFFQPQVLVAEMEEIMKKFLVLALAVMLAMGLTACGNKNNGNDNENLSQTEGNQTGNTNDVGNSTNDADENEVYENDNISMEDLKNAVVEVLGENYWPDTAITAEMLKDMYGISEDMYDEFLGETPMISTNVDTLLIIKAKDDQIQAVTDALNAYRDNQIENSLQYPMNIGKVQASRIETFGNYVCFVQLGADTMDLAEQGDEAVIEYCQQENERALDAIEKTLVQ